jgi:hypothetical protein
VHLLPAPSEHGTGVASFPRWRTSRQTLHHKLLATATATRRARRDGGSLEFFKVLKHLNHRVASGRMGFIGDGPPQADAKFGAKFRLDEPIRTQGFFGVVVIEISFAAGGCNPNRGQCRSAATGLGDPKIFDGGTQPRTYQLDWRESHKAIVVFVGPAQSWSSN